MTLEHILNRLKSAGAKQTGPRIKLAAALLKRQGQPVSVEALFSDLARARGGRCDLASVYRNLTLFEELGVVRRSDLFSDAAHFELVESGHHHRHHIICKSCQRIDPIDICLVKAEGQVLAGLGYRDVSHRLEFSGLCPACA